MKIETRYPLFWAWANQEFRAYFDEYIAKFDFVDYEVVPRHKGSGPTEGWPAPLVRYELATLFVIYGERFKRLKHSDILSAMSLPPPSPKTVRKWRSEKSFMDMVRDGKEKFATYMAKNIFLGSDEALPLPFSDSITDYKGLLRKFQFINEALYYSPELLGRISGAMSRYFAEGEKSREIHHYLGYHLWCIGLLYLVRQTSAKARIRASYENVCREIIGKHWGEKTLCEYLGQNTPQIGTDRPQKHWRDRFRARRSSWESDLDKGLIAPLLIDYFEELKGIVLAEFQVLRKGGRAEKNTLKYIDIETLMHFLAGTGVYGMSRPDLF